VTVLLGWTGPEHNDSGTEIKDTQNANVVGKHGSSWVLEKLYNIHISHIYIRIHFGSSSSKSRSWPEAEAAMSCFEGLLALWRVPPAAATHLLQAHGRERNRGDASTGAAPTTSCLDGALSWFREAPSASESDSGATASSPCHMHVSVEGVPPTVAEHARDSNLWPDLHMTIKAEAFDMAATHVLNMVTTSTESEQAHICTICDQAVIGVVFDSPWSGLAHYRCAAAEYELLLWSRERRHLRRDRQKVHKERWEDARTKRKPKPGFGMPAATTPSPNPPQLPSCMPTTCSVVTAAASMASGWTAFREWLPTLPNSAFYLLSDLVAAGFRRGRSAIAALRQREAMALAKKAELDLLHEEQQSLRATPQDYGFLYKKSNACWSTAVVSTSACKCWNFLWSLLEPPGDDTHDRRRKRLVQQGSRGAGLARIAAARRGVKLTRWSRVRRNRAVHAWASSSCLRNACSTAVSLAMAAAEGASKAMERLTAAWGWGRCAKVSKDALSSEDPVARQRQGKRVAFETAKQVL